MDNSKFFFNKEGTHYIEVSQGKLLRIVEAGSVHSETSSGFNNHLATSARAMKKNRPDQYYPFVHSLTQSERERVYLNMK